MEPRETKEKPKFSASEQNPTVPIDPERKYALDEWGVQSPEQTAAELLRNGGYRAVFKFTNSTNERSFKDLLIENLALHLENGQVFTVNRLLAVSERATRTFVAKNGGGFRPIQWWINELGAMIGEEQAPAGSLEDKWGAAERLGVKIRPTKNADVVAQVMAEIEREDAEKRAFQERRAALAAAKGGVE